MSGSKYQIRATSRYKKNLKLLAKRNLDFVRRIDEAVRLLERGESLPERMKDHSLVGELAGHRECHVLPDLLLIYRIFESVLILELVAAGSHSDLFGK